MSEVVTPPAGSRSAWKWVTLADVGKIITGNTPPTADAENYGDAIPFVKPTELVDRGIRSAPSGLAPQAMGKARVVPTGAVLVSCIGNLGKTGIAKVPVAFNQQINAVVFNENVIPEFGFFYVQTLKPWLYGESSATTIPIVNKGKFQQARFPLASLDEQREIVAELEKQFSRLDEAVANLHRVKGNLKRYKASVLKAAVEGRLVETEATQARRERRTYETGEQLLQRILEERRAKWVGKSRYSEPDVPAATELPTLPDGWTWSAFGFLGADPHNTVQTGPFGAQLHNTDFVASGVPVIAVGNLTGTGFKREGLYFIKPEKAAQLSRYDIWSGDILFARSGATLGKVCVAPSDVSDWRMTGHILRARLNRAFLNPDIAVYALSSLPAVTTQIFGSVRGVTRPGFNTSLLESVWVPVPPMAEQVRIIAEVDRHLSIIREVEAEVDTNLKRAQALRQATLQNAFQQA